MTTTNTHKITISRQNLLDCLLDHTRKLDETQHYCCVRVYPTGDIQVFESVSRECGQDEYYHRMPHPVSLFGQQGSGQCNIDWENESDVDSQRDALDSVVDQCIATIEEAGYEVTVSD